MDAPDDAPRAAAIVPAAGSGSRLGANAQKKTYVEIAGRPLIVHTLKRLTSIPELAGIWLVVAREDVERCEREIVGPYGFDRNVAVVAGGATRQESVFRGLMAVPEAFRYVLVHDGARPLVTRRIVVDVLLAARRFGAATAAVPVKDTLKRGDADRFAEATIDREWLWKVQTPQAFRRELLLRAHRTALDRGTTATDDAALVEQIGGRVRLVPGDERNVKVTTPDDVPLVAALLEADESHHTERVSRDGGEMVEIRTGLGYDIHQLVEGRRLVLGGVPIPHTHGLYGHSDADALVHAICDALLGAAGLGDIGTHFPDTDPQYRDCDSLDLLAHVVGLVAPRYEIVHIDSTIKAEAPRMGPHIAAMRERLARVVGIPGDRINVKAKTGEGIGPIGVGEAIETEAVVTLRRRLPTRAVESER